MKTILLSCLILLSSALLFAQQNNPPQVVTSKPTLSLGEEKGAKIHFNKTLYNFGVIQQGEKVEYEFEFTNIGTAPLLITGAEADCGCTVPSYPKEDIAPSKSGIVKVVFDSTGKLGKIKKTVTLTTNAATGETKVLYIVGRVDFPFSNSTK